MILKQADQLALGDVIAGSATLSGFVFSDIEIVALKLVGDDVEVNDGIFTTSRNNAVAVR